MATVYLARDLQHNRQVAIKVLRPELGAVLGQGRFRREIAIASSLTHPHIVPLLDSGDAGGLLFYVMPYIAGESLRQRLAREKQLPIGEATHLARDVAQAVAVAHARGIIHRDIKPENVLLQGGHALVTDFGIARAITRAAEEGLTSSGLVIGTPGYMSPEQGTGEKYLDARSDVYSLGCVLYEMLAGEPPYTGPTAQTIIAKQLSLPIPSIRTVRDTVPAAVDDVVRRTLAKSPADRFADAADFAAALERAVRGGRRRLRDALRALSWQTRTFAVAGAATLLLLAWAAGHAHWRGPGGIVPDTSRYVVLPFEYGAGVPTPINEVQLMQDALGRWSGLSVADPFQVRDALSQVGSTPLSQRDASRLAAGLGAGRYVRGAISRLGDSLRVQAGLYDAAAGRGMLAHGAVRLPFTLAGADSQFAALADRLLFRGTLPKGTPALSGTHSLPARQAFADGQQALAEWNLARADSAFTEAARLDTAYAQAQMWVALARAWSGQEPARWRLPAEQAELGKERLSARDRAMAEAVGEQARGDSGAACPRWLALTQRFPRDFASWYGAAFCLSHDPVVVRDASSPSRWRFRSSYQQMIRSYRRAFELHPSILASFSSNTFAPARSLLHTSTRSLIPGHALPPDTGSFVARPVLAGDSLVLLPYPVKLTRGAHVLWQPGPVNRAVQRQRRTFHDIAVAWASAYPRSAAAKEALAVSLEMLGDLTAVDTLRAARALTTDLGETVRLASDEVWAQVKLGVPLAPRRLSAAQALADSMLDRFAATAPEPLALTSLAALTGRAALAARLVRKAAVEGHWVPAPLVNSAPALLIFASLGGPVDSLQVLEHELRGRLLDPAIPDRELISIEWLGRPARLAAGTWPFPSAAELRGKGDYLLDAQAALAEGDSAAVRRTLAALEVARRQMPSSELPIDALYPEARLFLGLGDDGGAIAWLDRGLNALADASPGTFVDPARPGALVNALVLRADLAVRVGDQAGAQRWADAVCILWSHADDYLQPAVRRMQQLAGR